MSFENETEAVNVYYGNIKQGNKELHKFCGFRTIEDTSVLTDDPTEDWYKNDKGEITQFVPCYHSDWDWLWMAFKKVEDMGHTIDISSQKITREGKPFRIYECIISAEIGARKLGINKMYKDSMNDAVFFAIFDFILEIKYNNLK